MDSLVASTKLQNHLSLMEDWCIKLRFKVDQTKPSTHAIFNLKQAQSPDLHQYGPQIPPSHAVKYLVLILDQQLTRVFLYQSQKFALILHIMFKTLLFKNIFFYRDHFTLIKYKP